MLIYGGRISAVWGEGTQCNVWLYWWKRSTVHSAVAKAASQHKVKQLYLYMLLFVDNQIVAALDEQGSNFMTWKLHEE